MIMARLFLNTIAFLLISCLIISCGSDDAEGLKIVINSPEDNSTFNLGDEITVSFTVTDDIAITSIAYNTRSAFGTGSIPGSEFLNDITTYSGEFVISADASGPGTYMIDISATDQNFDNVVEETISVILE